MVVIHAIKLTNALIGSMIWRWELHIKPRQVLYLRTTHPQAMNAFSIPSKKTEMLDIQQYD